MKPLMPCVMAKSMALPSSSLKIPYFLHVRDNGLWFAICQGKLAGHAKKELLYRQWYHLMAGIDGAAGNLSGHKG